MIKLDYLIEVLEASAKCNGPNTPVTLGHLLNILKMVERRAEQQNKEEIEYDYRYEINN